MVKLVEVFSSQFLNDYSDSTGKTELLQAARFFSQEVERVNNKKYSNVWPIPKGYIPGQAFSQELVQLFLVTFQDNALVGQALVVPLSRWNPSCRSRFNAFDNYILPSLEFSRLNLELCESEMPNAVKGILSTVALHPKQVLTPDYLMLVYENVSVEASRGADVYGEGALPVPDEKLFEVGYETQF